MSSILFSGKIPGNLSKEEIRSIFYATDTILRYHNLQPLNNPISVEFTSKDLGVTKTGSKTVANANYRTSHIIINRPHLEVSRKPYSCLVTQVIHEMIHVFIPFDKSENEKLASTLTGKIKADVVRIANILVENTYQRAGFIAHTKISYKPKRKDFYDDSQYHKKHDDSNGKKYRRNEGVTA